MGNQSVNALATMAPAPNIIDVLVADLIALQLRSELRLAYEVTIATNLFGMNKLYFKLSNLFGTAQIT